MNDFLKTLLARRPLPFHNNGYFEWAYDVKRPVPPAQGVERRAERRPGSDELPPAKPHVSER